MGPLGTGMCLVPQFTSSESRSLGCKKVPMHQKPRRGDQHAGLLLADSHESHLAWHEKVALRPEYWNDSIYLWQHFNLTVTSSPGKPGFRTFVPWIISSR